MIDVCTENEKLKAAKSVLIVGGGPTGVELAGEIVTDFPDKKVTLVHGGARLLEFVGEKAGAKALPWLESKGVTVILNDKLEVTKGTPPVANVTSPSHGAHRVIVIASGTLEAAKRTLFLHLRRRKQELRVQGDQFLSQLQA